MFTGIVTALGTVRAIEPAGRQRGHAADGSRPLARYRGNPDRRLDRLLRLLPHRGRDRRRLVRRRRLGRDAEQDHAGRWRVGTRVNLERSLRLGDELGGHLVSGHVDGVGEVLSATPEHGSTRFVFRVPADLARFIAVKGSVAVDGVSLTVNEVTDDTFGVNIIPHTAAVTSFGSLRPGDAVNIEIDMLARYVARLAEFK